MGITQFPQSSGNLWDKTPIVFNQRNAGTVSAASTVNLFTITSQGILGGFQTVLQNTATGEQTLLTLELLVDGQLYPLSTETQESAEIKRYSAPMKIGYTSPTQATGTNALLYDVPFVFKFKNNIVLRVKNGYSGAGYSFVASTRGVYYT